MGMGMAPAPLTFGASMSMGQLPMMGSTQQLTPVARAVREAESRCSTAVVLRGVEVSSVGRRKRREMVRRRQHGFIVSIPCRVLTQPVKKPYILRYGCFGASACFKLFSVQILGNCPNHLKSYPMQLYTDPKQNTTVQGSPGEDAPNIRF